MSNLLLFLPDEAYPLIVVLLVVAVAAGLARARVLIGFVLFLVLLPVIGQLFDTLLNAMPSWLFVLLVAGLIVAVFRAALSLVIGRRAAAHTVGILAADVIRASFAIGLLPFRLVGWLLRRGRP